ncbi:dihydrodipicolinate reductase [Alkalispirochaeta sphaeroplastigenens]|uniref:Dihydrodipicolinate reductase n=1 Tax=Alkalispirochaeta sphaeroplastigenens TaxID=1187066 RepID=A0A2S4JYV6_9SPIO|nr:MULTISPECIES: hypothetical protein [Alkalispirochaeta]POR04689.1 dihydrodipicolinate reductase [Alkalispirochaeta sphaeroplastigenens]
MEQGIRVAQYGCGKMSVYTMRYVQEKGARLVAAFDANPQVVGKDISEITGSGPAGVVVQDASRAEEELKRIKPDVCLVTTMSLLRDVEEALLICARNGINAITICEEAIFPWNSAPTITAEIDRLARETGCTICGTGYQDVFWGNLITTLAGATHRITKIKGKSSYNVEDYGIALAKGHGAGLSLEEFAAEIASADNISDGERQKLIDQGTFLPSYMWNVNGWLCSQLGLTVTRQTQTCVPQTCQEDLNSSTLGMTIPAGKATGMSALVVTETKEGVTIESECIGKVYAPDECDRNEWTLQGEPETQVVITRPSTVELTCATMVNRIPDVINAPAGYVTTEKMPRALYRQQSLEAYLD